MNINNVLTLSALKFNSKMLRIYKQINKKIEEDIFIK